MKQIWTYITRHRAVFLFGLTALAAAASLASDPDNGWATALGGLAMLQGIWAVAASHWVRKKLLDYPAADMSKLFETAGKEPTGAGLALIAISILLVGLLMVFAPREEGAGVGQITRAYRADGSLRFDALADLRSQYGAELGALAWSTVYQCPDLQLRALVLMSRDSARQFRAAPAMLEFGDAGYNGGPAGVQRERRACALAKGCDPGLWFGNVELHCLKSREPLYGSRSACDINRDHVHNVFKVRAAKYEAAWAAL
jgi:hypothetical protein